MLAGRGGRAGGDLVVASPAYATASPPTSGGWRAVSPSPGRAVRAPRWVAVRCSP
ncbi:hypothetical protein ABZ793_14415 [Micromonospora sp. NPDC047465]|uniref:hypothetical protein n=1 Tax=Micromonospora sp. NPDC047465 TaxID=3154813 RepID=UPI0034018CAA